MSYAPKGICPVQYVGSFRATWVATMEASGHGLTSRPRETSSRAMLDELLSLLDYPLHSGDALLGCFVPKVLQASFWE